LSEDIFRDVKKGSIPKYETVADHFKGRTFHFSCAYINNFMRSLPNIDYLDEIPLTEVWRSTHLAH